MRLHSNIHHGFGRMRYAVARKVHLGVLQQDVSNGVAYGVILVADAKGSTGGVSRPEDFEGFGGLEFDFVDGHG
jgi:hypothetical protein